MLLIAAYGTLKKGFYNHYLLEGEKFLGEAISKERFSLGHASFPAVIPDINGSPIKVEIYEVSSETLNKLDRLEGYPDFYNRELYEFTLKDGKTVKAFLYTIQKKSGYFSWLTPSSDNAFWWTESGWKPKN